MTTKSEADHRVDDNALVKKAVRASASKLGLKLATLSEVTGVRREVFSREQETLNRKQLESCLLVIRATRSLSALVGGDEDQMKHWINTPTRAFNAPPKELMKSTQGLVRTVQYLDAMRAKI